MPKVRDLTKTITATTDKYANWTVMIELAKELDVTAEYIRSMWSYHYDAPGWRRDVVTVRRPGYRLPVMLLSPPLTKALSDHITAARSKTKLSARILEKLSTMPCTILELRKLLNTPWSSVYWCLQRLKDNGLVTEGNFKLWGLTYEGMNRVKDTAIAPEGLNYIKAQGV